MTKPNAMSLNATAKSSLAAVAPRQCSKCCSRVMAGMYSLVLYSSHGSRNRTVKIYASKHK